MRVPPALFPVTLLAASLLPGCTIAPSAAESDARDHVNRVGVELPATAKAGAERPVLPTLNADSTPADFVRYAVLNHPAVTAA